MTQRTDIHRPSAINPTEYEWVAQEYLRIDTLGDALFLQVERARLRAHMERTGGTWSRHEHGGNCMVCGSPNAVYTHVFHHTPTNVYVRMGEDCARKCDMAVDDVATNRFRRNVEDARKNVAGKAKAQATLADAGLAGAWDIYVTSCGGTDTWDIRQHWGYEENTIADIVGKLVQYGSISEKQQAFVGRLLAAIPQRAEREAQRAAEREAAAPAPTGRMEVTGEVVSVKANDFGLKMLVKAEAGWKLWVTVPREALRVVASGAVDRLKGHQITVRVTVTPSKDDAKFAFGSRPTLVKVA